MSFSGNSLNQGARIDHNTFMNNNANHSRQGRSQEEDSGSPPRRGIVPLSYAYGAPNLAKSKTSPPHRHPSPTRSNVSSAARNHSQNAVDQDDEAESNISRISAASRATEPGTVRYARLKQRNQTLGPSVYHPAAPGIILSPPNGTELRDTSVNVATAFNYAASSAMSVPTEKPRFTAPGPTRRIAAPPSRFTNNKPLFTASNTSKDDRKARAKSPLLETITSVSQSFIRAVSPTSYYLSEPRSEPFLPFRIDEPQPKPLNRQTTKASTVPSNDSYDYENEERMMQGEIPPPVASTSTTSKSKKKKGSTMSAAARLSLDNKAYRPSSDEDDEDDIDDSSTRRRKKSKKKDDANKALTTLPTIGYDKKKRKRKSTTQVEEVEEEEEEEEGGEEGEGEGSDDDDASRSVEQVRADSRPPQSRASSVTRDSAPPSHPIHFQAMEPSLEEIPETEDEPEEGLEPDVSYNSVEARRSSSKRRDSVSRDRRPRSRSRSKSRQPRRSVPPEQAQRSQTSRTTSHGIGHLMGSIVHFFFTSICLRAVQAITVVFFILWTLVSGIFDIICVAPFNWVMKTTRRTNRADIPIKRDNVPTKQTDIQTDKGDIQTNNGDIQINKGSARTDKINKSNIPTRSLLRFVGLVIGIVILASALRPSSSLVSSFRAFIHRIVSSSRQEIPVYQAPSIPAESVQDLIDRLAQVEIALADLAASSAFKEKETQTQRQIQRILDQLSNRLDAETQRAQEAEENYHASSTQNIARIRNEFKKIQMDWEQARTSIAGTPGIEHIEQRLGAVEGGVKDALELGKKVESAVAVSAKTKWKPGDSLTIRTGDGQNVHEIIGDLVDRAVTRFYKDGIGKPDFALYSAGGRVVPQLTSNTYEVKPRSWSKYLVGAITGRGYVMGRPPVTALHPDINVGNCWPFAGISGQIGVLLARNVYISEITIEHVPRDIAYDIRSAPRQMEVWGLVDGTDNIAKVREYQQRVVERRMEAVKRAQAEGLPLPPDEDAYPPSLPRSPHYLRLAQITYNIHAPNHIQTFSIPDEIQNIGADFGIVVLIIKNNWEEEDYTCLYRMRVHGVEKDHKPPLLPPAEEVSP